MHTSRAAFTIFLFLLIPFAFGYVTYEDQDTYYGDNQGSYVAPSPPYDDFDNVSRPYNDSDYYSTSGAFSDLPDDQYDDRPHHRYAQVDDDEYTYDSKTSRLPRQIAPPGEKVIVIDPRAHGWGAYSPEGQLIRSGLASAGANWCRDRGRPCRTTVGSFRIFSLGDSDCVSSIYPLEDGGGAPMPYCMFFNGNQGLHGSHQLGERNMSHGCVRVSVTDAEWIRFSFANVGTKVIVKPY